MKMNSSLVLAALAVLTIGVVILPAHDNKPDKQRASSDTLALQPTAEDLALTPKVEKSDADWRAQLSAEQFAIMRGHKTERACSSVLLTEHRRGVFRCAACGAPIFASDGKFDSGTGWPSFSRPFIEGNLVFSKDNSLGMERLEVKCARCQSHLGHVFDDGPPPEGRRFCINGLTLKFEPRP